MMKYLMRYLEFLVTWDSDYFKRRMKGLLYFAITWIILIFSIVIFGVANDHLNWGIGQSPSFVDGSGYLSINTSATANVFELKEVTSEFSVGNIITIGDSKKEHEITDVTELQKSESGNSQTIILMDGVGFETDAGMKVSVVR